jgi:hypothetical protein
MHVLNQNLPAADACDLLQKYQRIQRESKELSAKIVRIKSDAAAEIKALRETKLCDHDITVEHSGFDKWTECVICGEEVNEKPARFT